MTATETYDLIVVGGGIGASALAGAMAATETPTAISVLLLEGEARFRDRVRGEAIMPWGVAEAKLLGLGDALSSAQANPLIYWDSYTGNDRSGHRDLSRTTRAQEPVLACYHPRLQESLLQWAESNGARVRRGVRVTGLDTNGSPAVRLDTGEKFSARMIVGADGRGSRVRGWAGFPINQDPDQNLVAGVLMENVALSADAAHAWLDTAKGHFVLNFPSRAGPGQGLPVLSRVLRPPVRWGERHPRRAGPLRSRWGARRRLRQRPPCRAVGDLRRALHLGRFSLPERSRLGRRRRRQHRPDLGSGTYRWLCVDARVLRDQLLAYEDWDTAGRAYAEARQRYFNVVHTMELWQNKLLDGNRQRTPTPGDNRPSPSGGKTVPRKPRHLPERPRRPPGRNGPPPLLRRRLTPCQFENRGIVTPKLVPGIGGSEPLLDSCSNLSSFGLQCGNLAFCGHLIFNPAIQILVAEDVKLNLCHVEPASMPRSMVKHQPFDHPPGLLWLEGLVQGGWSMGVQVIEHYPDLLPLERRRHRPASASDGRNLPSSIMRRPVTSTCLRPARGRTSPWTSSGSRCAGTLNQTAPAVPPWPEWEAASRPPTAWRSHRIRLRAAWGHRGRRRGPARPRSGYELGADFLDAPLLRPPRHEFVFFSICLTVSLDIKSVNSSFTASSASNCNVHSI